MDNSFVTGITAPLRRIPALLGWTRASYFLLSAFLLTIFLIVYIWWPLAEEVLAYVDWSGPWWLYMDWLLLGIFAVMTLLIMPILGVRNIFYLEVIFQISVLNHHDITICILKACFNSCTFPLVFFVFYKSYLRVPFFAIEYDFFRIIF